MQKAFSCAEYACRIRPQNGGQMNDTDRVETFRKRQRETVAQLRRDLEIWIDARSGPPRSPHPSEAEFSQDHYVEISAALLETAIDRYIRLHDASDALDFVQRCFKRRAEQHRRSLQ